MSYLSEHNPYDPPQAPIGMVRGSGGDGDRLKAEHIEGSPWATIWTRPRSTIRTLIDTTPTRGVLLLAALSGVGNTMGQTLSKNTGESLTPGVILALAASAGPIAGILGFYFFGWLFGATGRWLGGRATTQEVRAAIAWGTVPNLPTLALMSAMFLAFGQDFFRRAAVGAPNPILLAYLACSLVFGIWTFFVSLNCIGEVQQFSSMKAFGSTILAMLVFIAVLIVLGIIVVILAAAFRTA